jgi:hypothetical protein
MITPCAVDFQESSRCAFECKTASLQNFDRSRIITLNGRLYSVQTQTFETEITSRTNGRSGKSSPRKRLSYPVPKFGGLCCPTFNMGNVTRPNQAVSAEYMKWESPVLLHEVFEAR